MQIASQAKYLGCWLNDRGDPQREVRQRISTCMTILKKLDLYWLHANPSKKQKLLVYDAVIRSKLLYGLESAALNNTVKHSLDIFQMKGIRKISGVTTTFIDRQNKTTRLYSDMQKELHDSTPAGRFEKF